MEISCLSVPILNFHKHKFMGTSIVYGERIARDAQIRLSCTAVIYEDAARQKILLVRRRDNAAWCLPGGALDAGESVAEGCVREIREETGLEAFVTELLGVYSTPHCRIDYDDGRKVQIVALCFVAQIAGGTLDESVEMNEFGYFSETEITTLEILETHRDRITDAFRYNGIPFIS
jgi:ADP-ribose pyrophosphatase YjhB (NUDIX family)